MPIAQSSRPSTSWSAATNSHSSTTGRRDVNYTPSAERDRNNRPEPRGTPVWHHTQARNSHYDDHRRDHYSGYARNDYQSEYDRETAGGHGRGYASDRGRDRDRDNTRGDDYSRDRAYNRDRDYDQGHPVQRRHVDGSNATRLASPHGATKPIIPHGGAYTAGYTRGTRGRGYRHSRGQRSREPRGGGACSAGRDGRWDGDMDRGERRDEDREETNDGGRNAYGRNDGSRNDIRRSDGSHGDGLDNGGGYGWTSRDARDSRYDYSRDTHDNMTSSPKRSRSWDDHDRSSKRPRQSSPPNTERAPGDQISGPTVYVQNADNVRRQESYSTTYNTRNRSNVSSDLRSQDEAGSRWKTGTSPTHSPPKASRSSHPPATPRDGDGGRVARLEDAVSLAHYARKSGNTAERVAFKLLYDALFCPRTRISSEALDDLSSSLSKVQIAETASGDANCAISDLPKALVNGLRSAAAGRTDTYGGVEPQNMSDVPDDGVKRFVAYLEWWFEQHGWFGQGSVASSTHGMRMEHLAGKYNGQGWTYLTLTGMGRAGGTRVGSTGLASANER